MVKQKLAIFDFCDTLFDGQSVSEFYQFIVSKQNFFIRLYINIRNRFNRIPSSASQEYKEFLFFPFAGKSQNSIEDLGREFFERHIKKGLHQTLLDRLAWHKEQGDFIVVASGGLTSYLSHFCSFYHVDLLISSELEFVNHKFTGKLKGSECLGGTKVRQLESSVDLSQFDLENSFVYSDHISDLPLFGLTRHSVVVTKKSRPDWAKQDWEVINLGDQSQRKQS